MRDKIILTNKIKPLFWEYDPEEIDLEKDRELVIKRVLSNDSVEDLRWMREAFGDEEIRGFLLRTRGRGIERKRLRFYEVIFDLPTRRVTSVAERPFEEDMG